MGRSEVAVACDKKEKIGRFRAREWPGMNEIPSKVSMDNCACDTGIRFESTAATFIRFYSKDFEKNLDSQG